MTEPSLNESVGENLFRDRGGKSTAAFKQPTKGDPRTLQRGLFDPFAARTEKEIFTPSGFLARYGLDLDGDATKGYLGGEAFLTDMVEEFYRHPTNPGRLRNNAAFKCDQVAEQDLKTVLIAGDAAYRYIRSQYKALTGKEPGNPPTKEPAPTPAPTTEPPPPLPPGAPPQAPPASAPKIDADRQAAALTALTMIRDTAKELGPGKRAKIGRNLRLAEEFIKNPLA